MSELKYDPELPFAIEMQPGLVWARFLTESDAHDYVEREGGTFVDTTPKPKIPDDARFLHWFADAGNYVAIWENFNPLKPWGLESAYYSEEELLEEIGDAEVTVLVRKGDS